MPSIAIATCLELIGLLICIKCMSDAIAAILLSILDISPAMVFMFVDMAAICPVIASILAAMDSMFTDIPVIFSAMVLMSSAMERMIWAVPKPQSAGKSVIC